MSRQLQVQTFHNLIVQLSTLNTSASTKTQRLLKITEQATQISILPHFADICLDLLQASTYTYTKDETILLTTFLKNKFLKQFQCMDTPQFLSHIIIRFQRLMTKIKTTSIGIITNISLCLAYIYIHKASALPDIMKYIRQCFPEGVDPKYRYRTLNCIPQQTSRSNLVIDDMTREHTRVCIAAQTSAVLQYIDTIAQQHWQQCPHFILQCFSAWIAVPGVNASTLDTLPQSFVFQAAIQSIKTQDRNVEEACVCLRGTISHINGKTQSFLMYMAVQLFSLLPHFQSMLKECQYAAVEQGVKMMCDFGEKAISIFINSYDQNISLYLTHIIKYQKIDQLDCFNNILDFWEIFLQQAISKQYNINDALKRDIKKICYSLYEGMCYNGQYPWKMFEKLNKCSEAKLGERHNQVQELLERRDETKHIFHKIAKLMGVNEFLRMVIQHMIATPKDDLTVFWPIIQSYINSLKKPLNDFPSVTPQLLQIVQSFSQLDPPHTILRKSYIKMIRSLMTIKVKDQHFIKQLFSLLGKYLSQPLLQDTVDSTFCIGCDHNSAILAKDIMQLIPIIQQYPNRKQLIQGVTLVMNENPSVVAEYLPQLLRYQCTQIQTSNQPKKAYQSLFIILDTLRFEGDTKPYEHILLDFTREFWPIIKAMLMEPKERNVDEDAGIERCVKLIKILMRCLRLKFSQFFTEMFEIVLTAYSKYPIGSYLYLLQVSITVFNTSPQYLEVLKSLYKSFCQVSYTYLDSPQKCQKYFLLTQDFFGLNSRFFIYNAPLVLESGQLPHILSMCLDTCVKSVTPSIAKATYCFFQRIFMVYWPPHFINSYNQRESNQTFLINAQPHPLHSQLKLYLLDKMQYVLSQMLNHLINCDLYTTVEYILDALSSQIKAFAADNQRIWFDVLQNIPSSLFVRKEKEMMYLWLPLVGSQNQKEAEDAVENIHRLLYVLSKRTKEGK